MADFELTQSQMSDELDMEIKAAVIANKKRAQLLEKKRQTEKARRLKKKQLKMKEINKHLNDEQSVQDDHDSSQVTDKVADSEEGVFRYSNDECATLASFVDKNYAKLYGKLSGPSYKASKDKTWKKCVDHMNEWHVERKNYFKGKIVERDEDSLKRKFENLKKRARDKVKMQKEHVTGNFTGPEPPSLNNIDLFILAMLGESPSFKGVLSEDYDTEIEVPQTNAKGKTNLSKYEAKKCRTNLLSKTPDMTKAINSDTKLNLDDLLSREESAALKKQIQLKARARDDGSVVSVKPVIQLNNEVVSDDDLYSDMEQEESVNIPMDTSDDKDADPDFEIPMTPVPSKRRKPVSEDISQSAQKEQTTDETPVSTPARGCTKKRKPTVEPDLNMRPKQGYTSYPAHLFDVPPSCLNVDHLRKKFLITEIAKSRASKLFFERGIVFMNFVTTAAHTLAEENGFQLSKKKPQADSTDHEYCMSQVTCDANDVEASCSTSTLKSKL